MRILKYFLISILSFCLVAASCWFSRCWILTTLTQFYFKKYDIALKMTIEDITFRRLLIRDIVIDDKNHIANIDLTYSFLQRSLEQVSVHVAKIDVSSLILTVQKMKSTRDNSSTTPLSFSEGREYCQKILKTALKIEVDEINIDQNILKPNLFLQKTDETLHLSWKDIYSTGTLSLSCKEDLILLEAPKITLNMKNFLWGTTSVESINTEVSRAFLNWSSRSSLQFTFPGHLSLVAREDKKRFNVYIPNFILNGQSFDTNKKEIVTHGIFKNVKIEKGLIFSFDSIDFSQTVDFIDSAFTSLGEVQFKNTSLKSKKDIFKNVTIHGKTKWREDKYDLSLDLKDQTQELNISNLNVNGDLKKKEHTLLFDSKKSFIKFNSQLTDWLPILKDFIKTASGSAHLQGRFTYSQQRPDGFLKIIGQNISGETEYGNFKNLSFSHEINSFERYSSPPKQQLKFGEIQIGPGITNLKAIYHINGLEKIKIDDLAFQFEEAKITARNFTLNSVDKRIENFSAVILNLSLEKALALGLKDSVVAKGRLQGHLDLNYMGKRPVLNGLLATALPGWIQYRTGKPQGQLSISDGPMDILDDYLYNFHYTTLSLTLSSDANYDMNMKLSTFGHNPDYLNGKPLKLNINLQQNLLAAMQSMMLTYDLPSKIKEKLEKVDP